MILTSNLNTTFENENTFKMLRKWTYDILHVPFTNQNHNFTTLMLLVIGESVVSRM